MGKKDMLVICAAVLLLLAGSVQAAAVVVLSSVDGELDSWGNKSFGSTVLDAGDSAYAGERVWHTYLKFDLPTLDVGESFGSAKLSLYATGYYCHTDPTNPNAQSAFRVWECAAFDPNTITWANQPSETGGIIGLLDTRYYGDSNTFSWVDWSVLDAMGGSNPLYLLIDVNRDDPCGHGGGVMWFTSFEQGWAPRIAYEINFDPCAVTETVDAVQDCYVDSVSPDTVFNGTQMIAGNWEQTRERSVLIRFELPVLAPGEDFYNAYLSLYQDGMGGDPGVTATFPIYDVNSPWSETTCTYNTMPTVSSLVGSLSTSPAENQKRVGGKVLDAVRAAGSGGTVNLMVRWDITQSVNGQQSVGVWKTKDNGNTQLNPRLELVLTTPVECSPALQTDVNGDCKIDFKDFAVLASEWLQCNWSNQALCQ
ncbi:MAG: DNRLRE domain-containing protein [Sedimentisphaerales bacterium]